MKIKLRKQLINLPKDDINPTGKLWSHQQKYVSLAFAQPRYIAAWDMGTGKTIFAVERDLHYRATGHVKKTLIIAPLATHEQWKHTIEYGSKYKAFIVNPQKRKLWYNEIKNNDSEYSYFILNIEGLKTKDLREPTICKRCKNFTPVANKKIGHRVNRPCKCKNRKLKYKYHLESCDIDHIIVDECHDIKNRNSQQTIAIKQLKIKFITDMSGSPATTKPDDLWSILNHVKPKSFSSYWQHFDEYIDYTVGFDGYKKIKGPSQAWVEEGLPSIKSFYSRILKTDVLELPSIIEEKLWVELHPEQRKLYDQMDADMMAWLIDNKTGLTQPMVSKVAMVKQQRLQIFALGTPNFLGNKEKVILKPHVDHLIALLNKENLPRRQLDIIIDLITAGNPDLKELNFRLKNCNPKILNIINNAEVKKTLLYDLNDPSPKIDLIIKLLQDYDPKKYVIFSQFSKTINLLEKRLKENNTKKNKKEIGFVKYTGDVPKLFKNQNKKRFIEDPECRVFIATIGSAGIGLDGLQHVCQDLIFTDRHPSPMLNNQAISRLHRAGQRHKVTILDIAAKDTIDDDKLWEIGQKYHALQLTLGDK